MALSPHHHRRRAPFRSHPIEIKVPEAALDGEVRRRLMFVGKRLFAYFGYADSSLADIARAADMSEEELRQHFDTKHKLLAAIYDDEWKSLHPRMEDVVLATPGPDDALLEILAVMTRALDKDRDLAKLWLFDGYRQRAGGARVSLPRGFIDFFGLITKLVVRGQRDRIFDITLRPGVAASLLIAGMEGLVRDWLLSEQVPGAQPYSGSQMIAAYNALVSGLRP